MGEADDCDTRRSAGRRGPPSVDDGLTAAELDGFDAAVARAAVAIAETGAIVLNGGPEKRRRAVSQFPTETTADLPRPVISNWSDDRARTS